jgi:bacterioferritin
MQQTIHEIKEKKSSSLTDISTLRKHARQQIESGAVTAGYAADRETVIRLLNEG